MTGHPYTVTVRRAELELTEAASMANDPPYAAAGPASLSAIRDERERRAEERRRRRLRSRRLRRSLVLLAILSAPVLLYGTIQGRPFRATLGGRAVWSWGRTSLAAAVVSSGMSLPHGDLVDGHGNVLRPGEGHAAVPVAAGRPVPYGALLREHRRLTFEPGADRREALEAHATPLVARSRLREEWEVSWQPEYLAGRSAVVGLERRETGAISGRPYLFDRALAAPLEPIDGQPALEPKRLALTFDDGPNGQMTRDIMDAVESVDGRATFFLLGDCIGRQEDLVRETVRRGHEIGNHSWGHPQMSRLGPTAALATIARAEEAIGRAGAPRCQWFRPPYGATTAAVRKAILEAGYNIALWSCDTNDWQRPGADTIYRRILAGARPGANILMHDGGPREQTVAAVRRAVPELAAMGYELVTLSELKLGGPGPGIGLRLTTDLGTWEARLPERPLALLVEGRDLRNAGPCLVTESAILVSAPAVLDALGVLWEWDREGQIVKIVSPRGIFRFRLDSALVTWDDREVRMDAPAVLYQDTPLIPARALARAADVRLADQLEPGVLNFAR
jgi:peptidoglycan/xylan/chitin deacetylase (PgdA/CDA1 family)